MHAARNTRLVSAKSTQQKIDLISVSSQNAGFIILRYRGLACLAMKIWLTACMHAIQYPPSLLFALRFYKRRATTTWANGERKRPPGIIKPVSKKLQQKSKCWTRTTTIHNNEYASRSDSDICLDICLIWWRDWLSFTRKLSVHYYEYRFPLIILCM